MEERSLWDAPNGLLSLPIHLGRIDVAQQTWCSLIVGTDRLRPEASGVRWVEIGIFSYGRSPEIDWQVSFLVFVSPLFFFSRFRSPWKIAKMV